MQRVPMAEFEPGLKKRLEELWGDPVNLYRAHAGWRDSGEFDAREHSPRLA